MSHGPTSPQCGRQPGSWLPLPVVTADARALHDHDDGLPLRPLPAEIVAPLAEIDAPARLAAHLRAVHDVAGQLLD